MAKNYNISATLEVINRFTKPIAEFKQQMRSVSTPVNQAKESIKGIERTTRQSVNNASNSLNKLVGKFKTVAASIGAGIGISKLIDTSDTMTNLHTRLNLMNDGLQTTDELQEKIFQSAQNSRGAYQDMAEMVAKLGVNAKDAFKSSDQIVKFGENMNKIFKLGGASSAEQSAGMLQLTQALASGKLQGDEFRSITENAPELIGILAEKLGKTRAEIKQMSTDGELTSDVIVNAVLDSTDKINSQFASMPMTWADVWTNMKNTTLKATQPILDGINYIVNSPTFKQLQTKFGEVANYISTTVIPKVQEKLPAIKQKFSELLALINRFKPLIIGVVSAFIAFKGINTAIKAINKAKTAFTSLKAVFAILTSPIGLVAIAIGAVVAALIYAYQHSETFRNVVNSAVEAVKEKFETFRARVQICLEAIQQFLERHKEEVSSVKEFISSVIELMISILGSCVSTIGSMLSGLITVITGVVDIIRGIFDGDWKAVWEGFKEVVKGAIEIVKGWWNGLLDLFNKPINFVVNLFKKDQSETETVSSEEVGENAKGTNNWRGGWTWVNEEGGELMNLPNGTQIIPHDLSEIMVKEHARNGNGMNVNIPKLADTIVVREDADIDRIGEALANKLNIARMRFA